MQQFHSSQRWNRSEGSMAGGGIGCHIMALVMPDRHTNTFSQMGGEGMQWVGAAPFSQRTHIFQNLGDGTYEHSGILAIRAAIAANTNITFKILFTTISIVPLASIITSAEDLYKSYLSL